MAALRLSKSQAACISGKNIVVFSLGSVECEVYCSEKPIDPNPDPSLRKGTEEGTCRVLASTFSQSGEYFVSCDDYKQITLWKVGGSDGVGRRWEKLSTRMLARRATAVRFTTDEQEVVVGDKSGDVYKYSVTEIDQQGELLMGHVSMLLDMLLMNDNKYVVTSDRDEKIRVSHYPNSHSIHSYCLGHTDFVSRLVDPGEGEFIISGSGDGTVRGWNYMSGTQLCTADCTPLVQPYLPKIEEEEISEKSTEENSENNSTEDNSKSEPNPERSTRQSGLDLKCLAFCRKHKLLAVGFEKIPVVLIFKFSQATGTMALTFSHLVTLEHDLWDMTFDPQGQLWALQANEESPLVIFCLRDNETFTPMLKEDDPCGYMQNVQGAANKWEYLKESIGSDSLFSVLHKVKVDNAKFYMERKQQKMEEQKQRYKEKNDRRKREKEVLQPSDDKIQVTPSGTPPSKRNKSLESA